MKTNTLQLELLKAITLLSENVTLGFDSHLFQNYHFSKVLLRYLTYLHHL